MVKIYKKICGDCKGIFYCGGLSCTAENAAEYMHCYCPDCSLNNIRNSKVIKNILDCPKAKTYKEAEEKTTLQVL